MVAWGFRLNVVHSRVGPEFGLSLGVRIGRGPKTLELCRSGAVGVFGSGVAGRGLMAEENEQQGMARAQAS